MGRFEGKVVFVTGSSRGIGQAITLAFAREGADVVVHYFRNRTAAEDTARQAEALGARTLLVKAHAGDPERLAEAFASVGATFGGLDVYVHNAASGRNRPVLDLDVKGWDWTMDVNVRAFLVGAQHAAAWMRDREAPTILSISSFGSQRVLPFYSSVGTSKAAIEALTRYLAIELAPQGIAVNCISAGAVETGALEHFPEIERTWGQIEGRVPAGRMVRGEDVAHLALFLASHEARMIRGQVVVIDGGLSLPLP